MRRERRKMIVVVDYDSKLYLIKFEMNAEQEYEKQMQEQMKKQ